MLEFPSKGKKRTRGIRTHLGVNKRRRFVAPSRIFWMLELLSLAVTLEAKRLPIKSYTTADGLPHNTVMRIVRDSHGFLWFCTLHGLSRFDGYTFKNYGTEQGLGSQVTDLLETHNGGYWAASLSGLYRFHLDPHRQHSKPERLRPNVPVSAGTLFELQRLADDHGPEGVNALHEDRSDTIWAATNRGLYQLTQRDGRWTSHLVDLGVGNGSGNKIRVLELFEDREGGVWVSLPAIGLRRVLPDGRVERYTALGFPAGETKDSSSNDTVNAMLEDHLGRIWLASTNGLAMLVHQSTSNRFEVAHVFTEKDGLRDNPLALLEASDGRLWVGTSSAVSELCAGDACGKQGFRPSVTASLGPVGAWTLMEDHYGNLWMGNESGVLRLARDGFTTFNDSDGLRSNRVYSISENPDGRLSVVTGGEQTGYINTFDGERFRTVKPLLPSRTSRPAEGPRQVDLRDHTGRWWVTSARGFFRYDEVRNVEELAHKLPEAVYKTQDGLPPGLIVALYEDSHGDIWIGSSSISTGSGSLSRWRRSTHSFEVFGSADGLTADTAPLTFCEDAAGGLWIGFYAHDVARYSGDRFSVFTARDGLPAGSIWSLHLDQQKRLWVATTEGGVARVDDPAAARPHFVTYTTADGLASNQIQAITEDRWGRIYVLTDRGVDRLDPTTGGIKHYTSADGLVSSSHWGSAFRDRGGNLWFGTLQGLSRLSPKPDVPTSPPPVRIDAIHVRGDSYPVSELGETRLGDIVLRPDQNQIQIDFASFNFGTGESPRYQYKLQGADREWSRVSDQRAVNYATVSPGTYRFLVRAVDSKGSVSSQPAEIQFRVLSPLWQRGWFLGCLAVLAALMMYAIYRSRLSQLLELERVRTRIATDLHDDIGSSLTQISILSEVLRQNAERDGQPEDDHLTRIANLSRELVDSMSDIVWAVNPRRDNLGDLNHRMRRFASDVLNARGIEFDFHAPKALENKQIRTDTRRQIFLVFKEGINNVVRHSQCRRVTIELATNRNQLWLRLADDGKGLDAGPMTGDGNGPHGHGLFNIARRAKSLGGDLTVDSHPGRGTVLTLRVPL